MTTLSALGSSLLALVAFCAVVWVALRVAQSIFGVSGSKAAATEVAAKLVAYPTGSHAVLRRRFVRALTGQHVIMPSGERHAYGALTVRIAPEDLQRLDPDSDTGRLGDDAAKLYLNHARRQGWVVPDRVTVTVEVDHSLRSGWVPPARGSSSGDAGSGIGWDVVGDREPGPHPLRAVPERDRQAPTETFAAFDADDSAPTMNVVGDLRLEHAGDITVIARDATRTTVLGRLPASPVTFDEPEVSYRHAAIRLRAGRWQLKDLGSTNGTTIDGDPVEPDTWTVLRDGAVIELAGVRVVAATGGHGTVHVESLIGRR